MTAEAKEMLSYPDLVSWLTDFERLALLPAPRERTGLASSYYRASQYDAVNDCYLAWGANRDADGVVRHEEGGDVLADLKGAGALVRIWSAAPGPGNPKVYIDGNPTPVFDAPFASFFDHSLQPFVWRNLVYSAGEDVPGFNSYIPIPFRRSLKILAAPNWGAYYQFSYVQFPQKEIASFALPMSSNDESALAVANRGLTSPDIGDFEQR